MPQFEAWKKPFSVQVPASSPSQTAQHKGPPLFCKAGHGIAHLNHDWRDISEAAFMLYQGERVNVTLPLEKPGTAPPLVVQGLFDPEGQKILFCPVLDGPPDQRIACASIYVLDEDLHAGIKRTLDIPNALKSGAVTCAYQQVNLKKLTTYPIGGQ